MWLRESNNKFFSGFCLDLVIQTSYTPLISAFVCCQMVSEVYISNTRLKIVPTSHHWLTIIDCLADSPPIGLLQFAMELRTFPSHFLLFTYISYASLTQFCLFLIAVRSLQSWPLTWMWLRSVLFTFVWQTIFPLLARIDPGFSSDGTPSSWVV